MDLLNVLGVSVEELNKLLKEHGQETEQVVKDAAASGLSGAVIMEALKLGGTVLVELLTDIKNLKSKFTVTQAVDVTPGVIQPEAGVLQPVLTALLPTLLPILIKQLVTPENIQKLITLLLGLLKPQTQAV